MATTMSESARYVALWAKTLEMLKSAMSEFGPETAAVIGEAVAYGSGQATDLGAGVSGRAATAEAMRRISLAIDLVAQVVTQVDKLKDQIKEASAAVAEQDERQAAQRRRLSI